MKKKLTELIIVGQLSGAHGVRGDVRVRSYTAAPEMVFAYGPLCTASGDVLLEAKKVRPQKDHFIVTPAHPREKEAWDALKGTKLYVPRSALPAPEEDEFYIEDLVGLQVFSGGEAAIGQVKAVLNHGAGDLLEITLKATRDIVLIPFTHADVPTIDIQLGRIVVSDLELWTKVDTDTQSGDAEPV